MPRTYTQRVKESILPLSREKSLPAAFKEWRFTGATTDHEQPEETCELCGQEGLRYHFEIANTITKHIMQIGSECILKFDLAVYNEGRKLSNEESRKHLHDLTLRMRFKSCLRALRSLAKSENNQILALALDYYLNHERLTPKLAFVVFWKLQHHRIDHSPSFFRISLRTSKARDDLKAMPTNRVHFFWRALTSAQRQIAQKLGHQPPSD